jgi:hypothetical protein
MTLMRIMTAAALLAFPLAASAGYGSDDGGSYQTTSCGTSCSPCGDQDSVSSDDASSCEQAPSCAAPCGAPVVSTYTPPAIDMTCNPCADQRSDDASSADDASSEDCGVTKCAVPEKPACSPCAEPVVRTVTVRPACGEPCVRSCTASACSAEYADQLRGMYNANLTELRFTALALTRTSDDDVADYLRHVQSERIRANEHLIALAADNCIDLGPGPDEAQLQAMLEPFRTECGPCLDQKIVQFLTQSEQSILAMAESGHERWDQMDRDNADIDDVDDFAAWQARELRADVDRGLYLQDDLTG